MRIFFLIKLSLLYVTFLNCVTVLSSEKQKSYSQKHNPRFLLPAILLITVSRTLSEDVWYMLYICTVYVRWSCSV
jgi:hypothetical protein